MRICDFFLSLPLSLSPRCKFSRKLTAMGRFAESTNLKSFFDISANKSTRKSLNLIAELSLEKIFVVFNFILEGGFYIVHFKKRGCNGEIGKRCRCLIFILFLFGRQNSSLRSCRLRLLSFSLLTIYYECRRKGRFVNYEERGELTQFVFGLDFPFLFYGIHFEKIMSSAIPTTFILWTVESLCRSDCWISSGSRTTWETAAAIHSSNYVSTSPTSRYSTFSTSTYLLGNNRYNHIHLPLENVQFMTLNAIFCGSRLQEYMAEGISVDVVEYTDNRPVLVLILTHVFLQRIVL